MKTFEIEYISMEGRHVGTSEEAEDESEAVSNLYNGSGDDPWQIISIEEAP